MKWIVVVFFGKEEVETSQSQPRLTKNAEVPAPPAQSENWRAPLWTWFIENPCPVSARIELLVHA